MNIIILCIINIFVLIFRSHFRWARTSYEDSAAIGCRRRGAAETHLCIFISYYIQPKEIVSKQTAVQQSHP